MLKRNLLFASALMVLASCGKDILFEQNNSIEDAKWSMNQPVRFSVNVQDTLSPYDFYINIRNNGDYGFNNLYLFLNTEFPNGQSVSDTLECLLASSDGKWLGSGLGDIYSQSILLKKKVRFPAKGVYRFEMIQAMRTDPLIGISDTGIRIEKSKD